MNLLIHDLSVEQWEQIKDNYDGYTIISNDGMIRPCCGCFDCWLKTSGKCIYKDGYEYMGAKLARADHLVIISKYTFGGFSSFVKNVMDRSISYVLPTISMRDGENHHDLRYPKHKLEMTVHFYGKELTEAEKYYAQRYLEAVNRNLGTKLNYVDYIVTEESNDEAVKVQQHTGDGQGIILLNCSLRGNEANSKIILERLEIMFEDDIDIYNLRAYLKREDELMEKLLEADKIVFSMPLYVDGLPSPVVRLFEKLYALDKGGRKKIYVIANMGFFESEQCQNLLYMASNWCEKIGYQYCGGLAIGAGEMNAPLMKVIPSNEGPVKNAGIELQKMAEAIWAGESISDSYVKPCVIPKALFTFMSNRRWNKQIVENGLEKKDLYRKI